MLQPVIVLTAKTDGGTQDVVGMYPPELLDVALADAHAFLSQSLSSARAIARIELYNPQGLPARKM